VSLQPALASPVPELTARGDRAAVMYTIIETAKLNGLDPEAYLRHLIARIADHPARRIGELLPWNVRL
jgi:hypothetical protein